MKASSYQKKIPILPSHESKFLSNHIEYYGVANETFKNTEKVI
jgi:hypothetical protein